MRLRENLDGSTPNRFHPPTPSATPNPRFDTKNASSPPVLALSGCGLEQTAVFTNNFVVALQVSDDVERYRFLDGMIVIVVVTFVLVASDTEEEKRLWMIGNDAVSLAVFAGVLSIEVELIELLRQIATFGTFVLITILPKNLLIW